MSILIKGMEMPKCCASCDVACLHYLNRGLDGLLAKICRIESRLPNCPLVPVPPHGDLIDRDALIKDGWLNLYKEVMRMGGYAIHELPLKNPSIAVIIPAEEGE